MNQAAGFFSAGAALALCPASMCGEWVCWEYEVVQLMRGGRSGCCGLERDVYNTSRSSSWLTFFLAADRILGLAD